MRLNQFRSLLDGLAKLTAAQLDQLISEAETRRRRTKALHTLETARPHQACPHCHDEHVVRNGRSRSLQRYRCRGCGRTFSVTTGTPLAGLHRKDRFHLQADCLARGLTVREAAAELGVAVSTAFRLRHRFLASVVAHQPRAVKGMLEADETYMRKSQKGNRHLGRPARKRGFRAVGKGGLQKHLVPVLVSRVRGQRHTADQVLGAMTIPEATNALRRVVGPDTLLCIDGSQVLRRAAAQLGVTAKSVAVSSQGRVQGVYHVQTVNSYHSHLKSWITYKLRGVATKYLPHYLAWMRVWEWYKQDVKPEHFIVSGLGIQLINT